MASENGSIKSKGDSVPVYVRMPLNLLRRVDRAVERGTYVNRSEAIRSGVRTLFRSSRKGRKEEHPAGSTRSSGLRQE